AGLSRAQGAEFVRAQLPDCPATTDHHVGGAHAPAALDAVTDRLAHAAPPLFGGGGRPRRGAGILTAGCLSPKTAGAGGGARHPGPAEPLEAVPKGSISPWRAAETAALQSEDDLPQGARVGAPTSSSASTAPRCSSPAAGSPAAAG